MSTLNIFIPKRYHTELIGRGGSVVKKLSSDNNVSVKIPSRDDPTAQIVIIGAPGDVQRTRKDIEEIVGFEVSTTPLVTMHLDLPGSYFGMLIGKGGSTLKDIEEKSRTDVTIPKREDKDQRIKIEGTKDCVLAAKSTIDRIVGFKVKVADSAIAELSAAFKKLDLTSEPINEALFFPEKDKSTDNFDRFLSYLRSASKTMDICVFTITDDRVANIIAEAHRSGIKVRIITDDETMKGLGSDTEALSKIGVPTKTDKNVKAHMHHKFAVIDSSLLINGSFNWTRQASLENHENMMITNHKEIVDAYGARFEELWKDQVNFVSV